MDEKTSFRYKNPKSQKYEDFPIDVPGFGRNILEHAQVGDYNKPELDAAREAARVERDRLRREMGK